jgi:hypothetical protein
MNFAALNTLTAAKASITIRKTFEQVKKEEMKDRLVDLYAKFIAEPDIYEHAFFEHVRKYVFSKVKSRHWDRSCAGKSVDDHTQLIMLDVYRGLITPPFVIFIPGFSGRCSFRRSTP